MNTMRTDPHAVALELGISADAIKNRGLSLCEEAAELEIVAVDDHGKTHALVPAAAQAWRSMKAAANAGNVQLFIVSAFRSVERQAEIIRRKRAAGQSLEEILSVCAPPGFSEHHTGRAVDLSTPGVPALDIAFEQTLAFSWLSRHASQFGFHLSFPAGNLQGYLYEPWHGCFSHPAQRQIKA